MAAEGAQELEAKLQALVDAVGVGEEYERALADGRFEGVMGGGSREGVELWNKWYAEAFGELEGRMAAVGAAADAAVARMRGEVEGMRREVEVRCVVLLFVLFDWGGVGGWVVVRGGEVVGVHPSSITKARACRWMYQINPHTNTYTVTGGRRPRPGRAGRGGGGAEGSGPGAEKSGEGGLGAGERGGG